MTTSSSIRPGLLGLVLLAAACAGTGGTDVRVDARPLAAESNLYLQGAWNLQRGTEAMWVGAPVNMEPDQVFSHLPAVYDSLGMAPDIHQPRDRAVGRSRFNPRRLDGDRLSTFLDCGYGVTAEPYADAYDVFMAVQTRVRPGDGPEGSTVETVILAEADPRQTRGDPVRCTTRQELEKRIVKALRDRLPADSPPPSGAPGDGDGG